MVITEEGLNRIERQAEKSHNAEIMLICHIIREIAEVKALLQEAQDASNGGNHSASSANDSENKHG